AEVGGHRPGRARGRLRRGHRLRRLGDRGLRPRARERHARQARPVDVPGPAVARVRRRAGHGADVLRHLHARRDAVVGRPAPRPAPGARQGRRRRLHLLHPPRDRVLPAEGAPEGGDGAGPGRRRRLLRPHPARRQPGLPARRDHDARAHGHLGGVQPPRGRARPAGDRPALRRRAVDRRQHPDDPPRHQGGGAVAGRLRHLHAQAVQHPARQRDAHPPVAVRGRPERLLRRRRPAPPVEGREALHRRPAPARRGDHRGDQPVRQLLQAAVVRWRGAAVRLLGLQQPQRAGARADVQAEEERVGAHRGPQPGQRHQPLPVLRAAARGRAQGDRGGLRDAARRRGRRLDAERGRAPGDGHEAAARQPRGGDLRHGDERAGRRDARGARLRLLPAQQARGVAGLPVRGHAVRARPLPPGAV
ncbi:MAG: Glutamine synthetase type I, partial [uncultured Solirubrobacteraceae bacterium]